MNDVYYEPFRPLMSISAMESVVKLVNIGYSKKEALREVLWSYYESLDFDKK